MLAYFENPIVVRELRSRMRGARAVWLQLLYVGVLTIVVVAAYLVAKKGDAEALMSGKLGRQLFDCLSVAQGTLLALTAPAFAAGAFTLEREQQTLETLLVSPLSTGRMVRGKLTAATLFLVLLLTISVPMLALTLLFGGVSPHEVVGTYAVQLANGLFLGAVGLAWSLTCNTTAAATMATYLTVIAYLIPSSVLCSLATDGPPGGFPLAAMSPITASFAAGQKVAIAGHEIAIWIPSVLAVLFLAAWTIDVGICRARRFRNAQRSGRPRWWMLAAVGIACTVAILAAVDPSAVPPPPPPPPSVRAMPAAPRTAPGPGAPAAPAAPTAIPVSEVLEGYLYLLYFLLPVGALALLTFATDDVEQADYRPGAWWAFWRGYAASGPLCVGLFPLLAWPALWYWARKGRLVPDDWCFEAGLAAAVAATLLVVTGQVIRLLNVTLGRRWPAVVIGFLGLSAFVALSVAVEALGSSHLAGVWWLLCYWMSPISNLGVVLSPSPASMSIDDSWSMALVISLTALTASAILEWVVQRVQARAGRVTPAARAASG